MPSEREMIEKTYAYCCNGDPADCDCVRPNHGTAFYKSVCVIPNCRNYAPASEAFCSIHRKAHNVTPRIVSEFHECPDEDWFEQVISDTIDMDWRPRDAAKAIVRDWASRWYPDHLPTESTDNGK